VWQPTPQHKCIINLPSTVEHHAQHLRRHDRVDAPPPGRRDSIVLSVHPHNDRGTGTAAGELALMAGATASRAACSATASAPATSTSSTWR
jgi:2-isopropylmalate synthase